MTCATFALIIFFSTFLAAYDALLSSSLIYFLLKFSPTIYGTNKNSLGLDFGRFFIESSLSISRTLKNWLDMSIRVLTFWWIVGRLRREVYAVWSIIYISNILTSIDYCTYIHYLIRGRFLITQKYSKLFLLFRFISSPVIIISLLTLKSPN